MVISIWRALRQWVVAVMDWRCSSPVMDVIAIALVDCNKAPIELLSSGSGQYALAMCAFYCGQLICAEPWKGGLGMRAVYILLCFAKVFMYHFSQKVIDALTAVRLSLLIYKVHKIEAQMRLGASFAEEITAIADMVVCCKSVWISVWVMRLILSGLAWMMGREWSKLCTYRLE